MTASALGITALALSLIVVTFWFRAVKKVALPKNRSGYLGILMVGAAAGAYSLSQGPGLLGGVAASVAIIVAAFFLLTFAIGAQKAGEEAIAVGETLPEFSAPDEFGETFDSQKLAGNPVLIKFFRGHW